MEQQRYYPKLTLRYPFEVVEMDGETIAVAIDNGADGFHGTIRLQNESARFMFGLLQSGISLPELILRCMQEFEDTVENVGPIVIQFLDTLKAEGLIVALLPQSEETPHDE